MKKNILITGASSDISFTCANFYAQKGDNIIVTYYQSKEQGEELQKELEQKYQVKAECLYLDLSDEESISTLFSYLRDNYNNIDILINNASLSMDNYYLDKSKEEMMKVLETNLVGTFLMCKYYNCFFKGVIINISSTDGIDTGSVYSIDYNMAKAGINMITKTMSIDSLNKIISICPNWIDTKSTRKIDKTYLQEEMERIKQDKLISPQKIVKIIDDCINKDIKSGSIIRIDGDNDVTRVN